MIKRLFYVTVVVLVMCGCKGGETPREWSEVQLNEFCEGNGFFKELGAQPLSITDRREFACQYEVGRAEWEAALEFLKREDLSELEPGKYALTELTYANVQEYETRTEGDFEYHRKYIDVQYMIKGREKCYVAPLSRMSEETKVYSEEDDCGLYKAAEEVQQVMLDSLHYGIYFPKEAHKPNMSVMGGCEKAKKVVVKIPVF